VNQAEQRDFALDILQTFADFLCSPSRTAKYEEIAFYSAGMHTRVNLRYEVMHAIESIRSQDINDQISIQELLPKLLPPFAPVENKQNNQAK
jgi:hypothetical protein